MKDSSKATIMMRFGHGRDAGGNAPGADERIIQSDGVNSSVQMPPPAEKAIDINR